MLRALTKKADMVSLSSVPKPMTKERRHRTILTAALLLVVVAFFWMPSLRAAEPPVFVLQPASQTVGRYSNAVFGVFVTGTRPISIEWKFDGRALPFQNFTSLWIYSVQASNAGIYTAVASNAAGMVESERATLAIADFPPTFDVDRWATNFSFFEGTSRGIGAQVSGTPPFTFQWFINGTAMPLRPFDVGTFSPSTSIVFNEVSRTNAGTYWLKVQNEFGTAESPPIEVRVQSTPPEFVEQPEDIALLEGQEAYFDILLNGAPRPSYHWYFNQQTLPGNWPPAPGGAGLRLGNVKLTNAGSYFVVASNWVGTVTSRVARLTVRPANPPRPGGANLDFYAGSVTNEVRALVVDADDRIVVAPPLQRLMPDGRLDSSFVPSQTLGGYILAVAMQGNSVIAGAEQSTSVSRSMGRWNEQGDWDGNFSNPYSGSDGFSGKITGLGVQPDGRILYCGSDGGAGLLLARAWPNGRPDFSFVGWQPSEYRRGNSVGGTTLPAGGQGLVQCIIRSRTGRIYVGTDSRFSPFTTFGVQDQLFNPTRHQFFDNRRSLFGNVQAVAELADGRIVVGGTQIRSSTNSLLNLGLAVLRPDGSIDDAFLSPFTNTDNVIVRSILPLPDGRLLVGGRFTWTAGDQTNSGLMRLFADGSIDYSFDPEGGVAKTSGLPSTVYALALRSDGKVLVGGDFAAYGNATRRGLVQVLGDSWRPPAVTREPESQIIRAGRSAVLHVLTTFPPMPSHQWLQNGQLLGGATNQWLELNDVSLHQAGAYQVIVSNGLGSATSAVAQVTIEPAPSSPGSPRLDRPIGTGADGFVWSSLRLRDGRILVAGNFNQIDGHDRICLAALKPDGSLDPQFDAGLPAFSPIFLDRWRLSLAEDSRGRIYVGGTVTNLDGAAVSGVVRLLPDGRFDAQFLPEKGDNAVLSLGVLSNDRVVIAGAGYRVDGIPTGPLAALNVDGSLFAALGTQFQTGIDQMALQPDGLCLLAMSAGPPIFRSILGQPPSPYQPSMFGLTHRPDFVAPLADGRFVMASSWVPNLAVFGRDGALDRSFDSHGFTVGGRIRAAAVDSCGRLLVAGGFTNLNGTARNNIARLLPSGAIDPTFQTGGFDGDINTLLVLPDDSVFIGGAFTQVDGVRRPGFAFLHGDPAALPTILSQPQDARAPTGIPMQLKVVADCAPTLTYQWYRNGEALPAATNASLSWPIALSSYSGNYVVVATTPLGSVTSAVAQVTVIPAITTPGRPDWEFSAGAGPDGFVSTMVIDAQHRLIIGGQFTNVDAHRIPLLARFGADGQLDPDFVPMANRDASTPSAIRDCRVDALGRLLVAGRFSLGPTQQNLVRVLSDGRIDSGAAFGRFSAIVWPDGVARVLPQSDDSVIATGSDTRRVTADGRSSFALNFSASTLAATSDGRWLAGGSLVASDGRGESRTNLARFFPDGRLDLSFNAGALPTIAKVVVEGDGSLLVLGPFSQIGGKLTPGIARLDANGALQTSFRPAYPWVAATVEDVQIVPGGKILLAGEFHDRDGRTFALARLRPDGAIDLEFDPLPWFPYGPVSRLAASPLGITYGGGFFPGSRRPNLVRFHGDPTLAVRRDGPVVRFEWWTVTGRSYHLDAAHRLDATTWRPMVDRQGNGGVQSFVDPIPEGPDSTRFFRLRVD